MTDFSIKNTSVNMGVNSSSSKDSDYDKLKKEYESFVAKASKSDLANAPVLIKDKLGLLAKLKEVALNLGLKDELEWIEEEQERLSSSDKDTSDLKAVPYYPVASSVSGTKKNSSDVEEMSKTIELCMKDNNGKIDENTLKIITAFKEPDQYFIPYIVRHCRDLDGNVQPDSAKAIEMLAACGMKTSAISGRIESLLTEDSKGHKVVNLALCNQIFVAKSLGYDDEFAFQLGKLLNSGYSNYEGLLDSVEKLLKSNVSQESVLDIVNSLTYIDKTTGKKSINTSAVNSVVALKNVLVKTRANERNERLTPLGQKKAPKEFLKLDDSIFYERSDGYIYNVHFDKDVTVDEAKKNYENAISQTEDDMLKEFIQKYKNGDDCSIDSKYSRIMSVLRTRGITNKALFALTDMSVNENGQIDKKTIDLINLLHAKGALSNDLTTIIPLIERDSEGNYKEDDINQVIDLTDAVLGEPQLSQLLPYVKTSDTVKSFILRAASVLNTDKHLVDLVDMTKSDGENIDDVALEIIDDLLFSENNDKTEYQFMTFIPHILEIARGSETTASDAAERICCSIDFFSPDEVQSLLEICTDAKGNVDDKLSQAVYKLYHEGYGYNVIMDKIEACKNGSDIDYDKLSKMV